MLQPVIDELQLDTTVEELARRITVVAPPNTLIIEITATAATPEEAQDIANAISASVRRGRRRPARDHHRRHADGRARPRPPARRRAAPDPVPLGDQAAQRHRRADHTPTAPVRVVNLEQAALPAAPNPSVGPLLLLVGGVLGLALGLLAASLREAVDRRIRTPRDVARVTDVPVVGAIVSDRRIRTSPLAARAGSRGPSAESFRALRAHLDLLRARDGRRVFVFTAAGRTPGRHHVAANLALASPTPAPRSWWSTPTCAVPALSALFGLQASAGLPALLSGRTELEAVLRGSGTPGLTVVPAGPAAANAGELLATPRMRTVLAELARRYEVVILDTPSIASASDAAVLGALTGSTLLIVAQGDTTRPRLDDALALLEAGGSEPLGIVLTRTRRAVAGRAPQAPPAARARARSGGPAWRRPAPAAGRRARSRSPSPRSGAGRRARPAPAARPVSTAVAVRAEDRAARTSPTRCRAAVQPARARPPRRVDAGHHGGPAPRRAAPATDAPRLPSAPPRRSRAALAAGARRRRRGRSPRRRRRGRSRQAEKPRSRSRRSRSRVEKPKADKPKAAPARRRPTPVEPARHPPIVTEIEHTLGTARDLDSAFAALPTPPPPSSAPAPSCPSWTPPTLVERPDRGQARRAAPVVAVRPRPGQLHPAPVRRLRERARPRRRHAGQDARAAGHRNRREHRVDPGAARRRRVGDRAAADPAHPAAARLDGPAEGGRGRAPRAGTASPSRELVELRPRTGPVPVPPLAREPLPVAPPATTTRPPRPRPPPIRRRDARDPGRRQPARRDRRPAARRGACRPHRRRHRHRAEPRARGTRELRAARPPARARRARAPHARAAAAGRRHPRAARPRQARTGVGARQPPRRHGAAAPRRRRRLARLRGISTRRLGADSRQPSPIRAATPTASGYAVRDSSSSRPSSAATSSASVRVDTLSLR